MRAHINYTSEKKFTEIRENTADIPSNCTSIILENRGDSTIKMEVQGTEFLIRPGDSIICSNDPDVLEITLFEKIEFLPMDQATLDAGGENYLFVIKENVLPAQAS